MAQVVISGARIFDGSGAGTFGGEVLVDGNHIVSVVRNGRCTRTPGTVRSTRADAR